MKNMSDFTKENKPLDSTDWRILDLLQKNGRMTYSDIAVQVHLSTPAVIKRVRRLEDAGIIRGYRAEVDAARLNLPVSAFIRLTCSRADEQQFQADLPTFPEITECHLMSAAISFVIRAQLSSVAHLHDLLARLGHYGETDSAIVLESLQTHVLYRHHDGNQQVS